MKKLLNNIAVFLLVGVVSVFCISYTANRDKDAVVANAAAGEYVDKEPAIDYAGQFKIDLTSTRARIVDAPIVNYIDGDTTHFKVDPSIAPLGLLKIRYLGVDTPESTARVEPWGNKAKEFTNNKLRSAVSIIVESNNTKWEADSTGSRFLGWVWYKTAENSDYRNLNLELLQNGLARIKNSTDTPEEYKEILKKAHMSAQEQKLNMYSGEPDPDFFYGDALEVTLKELRVNQNYYKGKKVAFEGIVSRSVGNGVYIESFDAESGVYFGVYCYYGFGMSGDTLEILNVGNRARIVGVLGNDGVHGWQVTSLVDYDPYHPDDPNTVNRLDNEYHEIAYTKTTASDFLNRTVDVEVTDPQGEDGAVIQKTLAYKEAVMDTSIYMEDLYVSSIYTTNNGGPSDGAMTLTCKVGDDKITVRTEVLTDENDNLITADSLKGKTINIKGFVEEYKGKYQIKVLYVGDIKIPGEVFPVPKPRPPKPVVPDNNDTSSESETSGGCASSIANMSVLSIALLGGVVAKLLRKRED